LNYHNLTKLAQTTFRKAKTMSVAKETTAKNWDVVNSRRYLMNAIAQVRQALIRRIEQRQGKETEMIAIAPPEEEDAPPSALTRLCQIYGGGDDG